MCDDESICPVLLIRTTKKMSDSHSRLNSAAFLKSPLLHLWRCCVFARLLSKWRFSTNENFLDIVCFSSQGFSRLKMPMFYIPDAIFEGTLRKDWTYIIHLSYLKGKQNAHLRKCAMLLLPPQEFVSGTLPAFLICPRLLHFAPQGISRTVINHPPATG